MCNIMSYSLSKSTSVNIQVEDNILVISFIHILWFCKLRKHIYIYYTVVYE